MFQINVFYTKKEGAVFHHISIPHSAFRIRRLGGVRIVKKYIKVPIHSFAFGLHRWDEINGWNKTRQHGRISLYKGPHGDTIRYD